MGRRRMNSRESVLDGAQRVVSRDGAARLTIGAVAAECGVSKATVLYDHKTKHALIKAVIERRLELERERAECTLEHIRGSQDAFIRNRIASTLRPQEDDRSVALSLVAALAQDSELREPVRIALNDAIERVEATSNSPRGARLAFLALEGLRFLEWFDLHEWSDEERKDLLGEIRWLVDQEPHPVEDPALLSP